MESEIITLYHGTARYEDISYPSDNSPAKFTWFTTSKEAACRYARFARMNGDGGDPRVLIYHFNKENLEKMERIADLDAHGEKVFGTENYVVKTSGKHSLVFRVARKNTIPDLDAHFRYFYRREKIGFIEKGVYADSEDWVFLETKTGLGASNWLVPVGIEYLYSLEI